MDNVVCSQQRNVYHGKSVRQIHITADDIIAKFNDQGGKCYWSGLPLQIEYNSIKFHPFAISPERINNDEDYTYDNFVLTRRMFNLGRMAFPHNDFKHAIDMLRKEFILNPEPTVTPQMKEKIKQENKYLQVFCKDE